MMMYALSQSGNTLVDMTGNAVISVKGGLIECAGGPLGFYSSMQRCQQIVDMLAKSMVPFAINIFITPER